MAVVFVSHRFAAISTEKSIYVLGIIFCFWSVSVVRYMYGDSTEFPLKNDFLAVLRDFIDVVIEAADLEEGLLNADEAVKTIECEKESDLEDIKSFKDRILVSINETLESFEENDVLLDCSAEIKEFVSKTCDAGAKNRAYSLTSKVASEREKITGLEHRMLALLDRFFTSDPLSTKEYSLELSREGESYNGRLTLLYDKKITCQFETNTGAIGFWSVLRRVTEFKKDVKIPVGMKKPLLKKELVVDYVDIGDYVLTELTTQDRKVQMVLKRQIGTDTDCFKLDLNYDSESFDPTIIYVDRDRREHNIMRVEELSTAIDLQSIKELGTNVLTKAEELIPEKNKLLSTNLNGENVVKDKRTHELMVTITQIYEPLISEIRKRSISERELILKAQDESGERREIYLELTEITEPLSALGEQGKDIINTLFKVYNMESNHG